MYLVVVNDERGGLVCERELRSELTIGRTSENGIVLPSGAVSRQHATLYIDHGSVFIVDHQSANGVYINGEKIQGTSQVNPEDLLRVGSFQLMVEEMAETSDRGGYQTAVVHPNQAHGKLVITSGAHAGKELLLFEPISVVGRTQENEVTISDISVSRRHAMIDRKDDGSYIISDQGSSNGTFVRGKRLRSGVRAWHGDKVRFGKIECLLVDPTGKVSQSAGSWKVYVIAAILAVAVFILGQLVQ